MKVRLIVLASILLVLFSIVSGLFITNNSEYRIMISSLLSVVDDNAVNEQGIMRIEVVIDNKAEFHFKRLYRDYYFNGLGDENNDFLEYYKVNNKWKKASLIILNDTFKVKIKGHGRTPYAQKYGDNISYTIKFKGRKYPFLSKRINFIIYNRIQLSSEILKLIGHDFNLYYPESKLVYAKVGSNDESLYFVEERINKSFFKRRKLNMVIFNKGVGGSLIYNELSDIDKLSEMIGEKLKNNNSLSTKIKEHIIKDYRALNKAIKEGNTNVLKKYFNLDYMSRLNAFRIVYGSDGHGFNSVNLEMAYDTITRLFYPIIHRDMHSSLLTNIKNPYSYIDNTNEKLLFWIALDSDKQFIDLTKEKINYYLSNNEIGRIETDIDEINKKYKELFIFDFSYLNNGLDGSAIINNIKTLNMYYN